MAVALPVDASDSLSAIICELETAYWRPDSALRRAVAHADELAPKVIELVEKAADGVFLLPKQESLLFWGIHVLAAARCTALYRPLLRLLSLDREEHLDRLFGDAMTETLPRVLISVFDGNAAPLFETCAQPDAESFLRWTLFDAIGRLTYDGAIPRATTVEFLDRFERERMAEPGDEAWEGWQDVIWQLGIEELYDRLRATWKDERNPCGPDDQEFIEEKLAEARAAGNRAILAESLRSPIDDPLQALAWTSQERHQRHTKPTKDPFGADPAADIALTKQEVSWLTAFLDSRKVPDTAMCMEELDGFFCALIAGPSALPTEYMPVVWDTRDQPDPAQRPNYDSTEQAEYVKALIGRHWKTIATRLDQGYPHEPVIQRWRYGLAGTYWAIGFVRGAAMRTEVWAARDKGDFASEFLDMVAVLISDENESAEAKVDAVTREKLVGAMRINLQRLYNIWHGRPDPFPPPPSNRYEGRKIGRNETCPCGSGKKFKRCCGSANRQFE